VSCTHQPAGFVLLVQACVLQSCDAYWLPTPFSCFPFTSLPVRHRVPSHFKRSLPRGVSGFHSCAVEESILQRFDWICTSSCFSMFRRQVVPSFSRVWNTCLWSQAVPCLSPYYVRLHPRGWAVIICVIVSSTENNQ